MRSASGEATNTPKHLPPDVATAMNIYRHELIERIGKRHPERYTDWKGRARKLADGQRDRRKQAALYVRVGDDGSLSSEPSESQHAYQRRAGSYQRPCLNSRRMSTGA